MTACARLESSLYPCNDPSLMLTRGRGDVNRVSSTCEFDAEGLPSSQTGAAREAVVAPALAAPAVVHDEEVVGIVGCLHRGEARIARPPVRARPVGLEVVALRDVRARIRHERADLGHRPRDSLPALPGAR